MFTKINLFAAALVSTLALSAFGSESTQAGRYRVEGPGNAGNSAQAGRYHVAADNTGAVANQIETGWAQIGQAKVAGRYRQGPMNFAPAAAHNAAPEYAQIKTQRAVAADVSAKPATAAGCCK